MSDASGDGAERRVRRLQEMHQAGGVHRAVAWTVGLGGLFLGLVLLVFLLSSVKKTPRAFIGISYGGGPVEGQHFQFIKEPGSNLFVNGFADKSS